MANHKIKKEFEDLEIFIEGNNPIVEYKGKFYWIGEDKCPFDHIDNVKIENQIIPAFRKSIGIQPPISEPYNTHMSQHTEFKDGIILDKEFGYLPSNRNRIYKKMLNDNIDEEFIVTKYDDDNNPTRYCIKNSCNKCEYNEICKPELEEIQYEGHNQSIVVFDISAQEPVIAAAIVHREPRWLETFRNRSQREELIDVFLNIVIQEEFGLDINHHTAYQYWEFLEYIVLNEELLSSLIDMNNSFYRIRANEEVPELEEQINFMIDKYKEFLKRYK